MNHEGELKIDPDPIFEVEVASANLSTHFFFNTSLDKNYIAASVISIFPFGRNRRKMLVAKVFNEKVEMVNKLELQLEVDKYRKVNIINDLCIDNIGNIHVLYSVVKANQGKYDLISPHILSMSLVSRLQSTEKNKQKILKFGFTEKKGLPRKTVLMTNNQGHLWVIGLYYFNIYKRKKGGPNDGLFVVQFDKQQNIIKQVENPFSTEYRAKLLRKKAVNTLAYAISPWMQPRYTYQKKDGGLLLICEEIMPNLASGTDYFNNVTLFDMTADGEINWVRTISKNQSNLKATLTAVYTHLLIQFGTNHYYSFATTFNENKVAFLFNDHPKNVNTVAHLHPKNLLQPAKGGFYGLANPKNGVPVVVTVSPTGELSKRIPLSQSTDTQEIRIRPALHYQLDNGDVIVYGNKGKTNKLGRLRFQ